MRYRRGYLYLREFPAISERMRTDVEQPGGEGHSAQILIPGEEGFGQFTDRGGNREFFEPGAFPKATLAERCHRSRELKLTQIGAS